MEALRKAEQAKRQAQGGAAPAQAPAGLELAPLDAARGAGGIEPRSPKGADAAPNIGQEFHDNEFFPPESGGGEAVAARRAPARPRGQGAAAEPTAAERAAAQNLFEAKEPPARSPFFGLAVGSLVLLAIAGGGIYFWLQLRPPASGVYAAAPTASRSPSAPALPADAAPPPAQPPMAAAKPQRNAVDTAPREPSPSATPAADGEAPIRITTANLRVDPGLSRAYEAYTAGDLAAARNNYDQLLKNEPKNGDAWLGLAAIALRQGRPEDAANHYLRALEADPKNALAQAGLIGLNARMDPLQAESRLKTLLAAQPEMAALHFALGNVYARQDRWNEAQQAYFKAYTGDADNPDFLFNLAVSLDQLHQPKLAAQYPPSVVPSARSWSRRA